jgi:ribokinase
MALPRDVYRRVDYLTPNETEAAALVGFPVPDLDAAKRAAETLRGWGARNVLITLGAQGVYVCGETFEGHVPAFPVERVVDTTGAGDAFNGGFVAALAEGQGLYKATRFGCAVASLSVTRAGTAPAMPRRAEVDALLAARP